MQVHRFSVSQVVPFPVDLVWRFFSDAANLPALTPPEVGFEAGPPDGPVYPGQILTHRIRVLPGLKMTWVTEILQVEPGRSFVDGQAAGPFRFWRHRHVFVPVGEGTEVQDTVHWAMPLDPFSRIARSFVRNQLDSLFACRARVLPEALASFARLLPPPEGREAGAESPCGPGGPPLNWGHGKSDSPALCEDRLPVV